MDKEELKQEILRHGFACHELNLFCDTHPNEKSAIEYFHTLRNKLKELIAEYTENYGPLNVLDQKNANYWDWINDPWPWEREAQ